jgi:hypothetical protein
VRCWRLCPRCFVELADEFEPGALGERGNRCALAPVVVFVGPNIGGAGRADVGDGLGAESP